MPEPNAPITSPIENFIARWKASGASERANYQLFLTELCDLLGVENPRPATDKAHEDHYCFERPVVFNDGEGRSTTNYIDLYKKDCFVLEAKQGTDGAVDDEAKALGLAVAKTKSGTAKRDTRGWELAMKSAKEQALRYARSLPQADGWPPFLVVCDVGYCLDLYSDFARQGKTYIPFPDPQRHRIRLEDLRQEEVRERLRLLFTDPLALDPSRRSARVTRELAERLGKLAASLEASGHSPEAVATFLMRCLFTMFAEDVGLLPDKAFTDLITAYKDQLDLFPDALRALWQSMDTGGFAPALHAKVRQFNGSLFKNSDALPVTAAQLELLIQAAQADWAHVEPAIFGTLLERALQPRERHKLGAHYTPRAYVERLVMPTVIEPLREEWEAARTAAVILEEQEDVEGARKEVQAFHRHLCSVRILDPACGSGNFLYVTLEHLKRLESEVTEYLRHFPGQIGLDMSGAYTVTPEQFLGLEINPRAAAIADVVLWIGYLQWHFRTSGNARRLDDPILRAYGNIRQQDAVLAYQGRVPRLDAEGKPVTRWDGVSTKPHPVTRLEVPDESARIPVYDYLDPKPAEWPEAEFIVGNPPFIGKLKMREALGDGYVEALRRVYENEVPDSADFVMFWWYKSAELLKNSAIKRFGFITTNSIKQSFNRRVMQSAIEAKEPISIVYTIPDHPWVDSADGAAVRIAMTVATKGKSSGRFNTVTRENFENEFANILLNERMSIINADLSTGADVSSATLLQSNKKISSFGMMLAGSGFLIDEQQAIVLGLRNNPEVSKLIKPFRNGKDLAATPRHLYVIDTCGLSEAELRKKFPDVYQHLFLNVKPERDNNRDRAMKEKWWLFGRTRTEFREATSKLKSYISTPETAKFRYFVLLDSTIVPDHKLVNIALDDTYFLGVLNSTMHVSWAMAAGGRLGVGNDSVYNSTRCFQAFPFPAPTQSQKQTIRDLAEQLDAHRKNRQALHPELTMTDMYNVLEKLKLGEALNKKEQGIHEQGLVSVLKGLHDELDKAVAEAYGWPADFSDEEILERLVALNAERAAEEARGLVRWLRPEYQNPSGTQQAGLEVTTPEAKVKAIEGEALVWPDTLADQALAIQRILQSINRPITTQEIFDRFKIKKNKMTAVHNTITDILNTMVLLGIIRVHSTNQYTM